jgi:hypothetical protein
MFDGRHVGDGSAHPDDTTRPRAAVEPREVTCDGLLRVREGLGRDDVGEPERLGIADRADGFAEALVDAPLAAERELAAAAAGIEDDQRTAAKIGSRSTPW